jgi:hypothetical protein
MTRYSMHLRDGTEKLVNADAIEFPSLEALQAAVLVTACDLLRHDDGLLDARFRIDAEDEAGAIVYSLQLKQELHLMPEPAAQLIHAPRGD